MADKKTPEPKVELEREYVVPLRKGWLKVPKYKRANKAVKTLKEFIAQHMKVYDRDLRKIRVDILLNNEIRFRGMKKPPAFVKVKAKKTDDGIVRVELAQIPDKLKFKKSKEEKKAAEIKKRVQEKAVAREAAEAAVKKEASSESEDSETEKNAKEKEAASKEESLKIAEEKAKDLKHTTKTKETKIQRKALSK